MRSRIVLAAAAVLLLSTELPAAAAVPFGGLEAKVQPMAGNATYGLMHGTGWALDDSGVREVLILVDGVPQVKAIYGFRRPGVTRRYPGFPNSAAPAFVFAVDTTRFLNGIHHVTALVTGNDGETRTLGPVRMQFLNAPHMLKPFGLLQFPQPDAVLHGRCNLADPTRRWSVVQGVVFDAGVHEDDTGVHNVDLLVDGSMVASTKVNCSFVPAIGGYTNCYGLASPAFTQLYPTLPDSDRGMYRFAMDVGFMISGLGYREGSHKITIRADDFMGNYRNIQSINVFFQCDENLPNEPSFGGIDQPINAQPYSGTITVVGWALDIDGIPPNGIQIRVNNEVDGTTSPTVFRPDITTLHPSYPVGTPTLIGEMQIILDNRIGP